MGVHEALAAAPMAAHARCLPKHSTAQPTRWTTGTEAGGGHQAHLKEGRLTGLKAEQLPAGGVGQAQAALPQAQRPACHRACQLLRVLQAHWGVGCCRQHCPRSKACHRHGLSLCLPASAHPASAQGSQCRSQPLCTEACQGTATSLSPSQPRLGNQALQADVQPGAANTALRGLSDACNPASAASCRLPQAEGVHRWVLGCLTGALCASIGCRNCAMCRIRGLCPDLPSAHAQCTTLSRVQGQGPNPKP